jgi:predicted  nucleic acid-binding Zn-ribbon protein
VSIQAQIEALEELAAIDTELADLRNQLAGEQGELSGKRQQLQELDDRVSRSRESVDEMDRLKSELFTEVRQMTLQVERSREKLARCRTEREANAAQRELEELRKLQRDREIEIEKLNGLVEAARSEIEDLSGTRDTLQGDLGSSEGDVTSRLSDLESGIRDRETARQLVVKKLPPQLFRKYEMIRKRRGGAVAHTTDGTCSACNMAMPPQQFQILMRDNKIDSCPQCNRLIYFKVPSDEDQAADGAGGA